MFSSPFSRERLMLHSQGITESVDGKPDGIKVDEGRTATVHGIAIEG